MSHHEVMKKFKELFCIEEREIDTWFQNGKNSIRVRNKNKVEFVFTYENDHDWCLETAERFLKKLEDKLKGE